MGSLRFLKPLQKQDPHGIPEILSKLLQKPKTNTSRGSFILLQNEDPQGALEILKTTSKTKPTKGTRDP